MWGGVRIIKTEKKTKKHPPHFAADKFPVTPSFSFAAARARACRCPWKRHRAAGAGYIIESVGLPITIFTQLGIQGLRTWGRIHPCHLSLCLPLSLRAMSSASSPKCSALSESHALPAASLDVSTACASDVPDIVSIGSAATESVPIESAEKSASDGTQITRMSKIKVALVLGYNGSRFGGLQRNPGQFTIEDVVEEAVYKVGGIADSNYRDFHKISWTRAARTDKGVHATGNVVSFKMMASCVELKDGSTVRRTKRQLFYMLC